MNTHDSYRPKKSWGQNFLRDTQVLTDIVDALELQTGDVVVELGAGLGALTRPLMETGCKVVAVERDRDLLPRLRQEFAHATNLELLEADAAAIDYAAMAKQYGDKLIVAGNLPYQISSRILVNLADASDVVKKAVVMVQKEVALRCGATAGNKTYGLLSVLLQRVFDVAFVREVSPSAFEPRPKVVSAVIRLRVRSDLRDVEADRCLVAAARAGFSARRKTLRNALANGLQQPADQIATCLRTNSFDPDMRAENLNVSEFARLGAVLHQAGLI